MPKTIHIEERSSRLVDTDKYADIPLSMPMQLGLEEALRQGKIEYFLSGMEALSDLEAQFYPQEKLVERFMSFQTLAVLGEGVFSQLQESTVSVSGTRTFFDRQSITDMVVA